MMNHENGRENCVNTPKSIISFVPRCGAWSTAHRLALVIALTLYSLRSVLVDCK